MKKSIFLLISILVLAFSVSSCAPADRLRDMFSDKGEDGAAQPAEPEDNPAGANTVTVGIFNFDTFNPLTTQSQTVREAMEFVYEPLFELNEQVQPEPALARDYAMSPDGRTITINLRDDVRWHDGDTMTAYDAAYSVRMVREGKTSYTELMKDAVDQTVTGDYQLTVSFNHPVPLAASLFTFPIVKYDTPMTADAGYNPIGTGAFAFSGRVGTDRYMLNAFDYYYGGRAKLDGVYIDEAPDEEHYIYMCSAGAFDVSTDKVLDLKKYTPKGSVVLNEYVTDRLMLLGINCSKPELSGASTRRALSELTDREYIVDSILYSRYTGVDVPINPSLWLYGESACARGIRGDEAESYLEADGWTPAVNGGYVRNSPNGQQQLKLTLITDENEEKKAIADKLAETFHRYGIAVQTETLPYDQYSARIASGMYDIFVGEYEIPATQDLSGLVCGGNIFRYSNVDMDTLAAQMGMTSNTEELKTLYPQLGELFRSEMPFVPIAYKRACVMNSAALKDVSCPGSGGVYRNVSLWRVKSE